MKAAPPSTWNVVKTGHSGEISRDIFYRKRYNYRKEGETYTDSGLEKFYSTEFENYLPDWIKALKGTANTGSPLFYEGYSRRRFIQFCYNHVRRGPDFLEPIVEKATAEVFHENIVSKVEDSFRKLSKSEKSRILTAKYQTQVAWNSRVENLNNQSIEVLETLNDMNIIVASPSRDKDFIVASNPFVRVESYVNQPLGEPGVELWTTFAPKIAVGFVSKDHRMQHLLFDDRLVRKLNENLAKGSRAIAGRHQKQLKSLARKMWTAEEDSSRLN